MGDNLNYAVEFARPVNNVASERYGEGHAPLITANPIIEHMLMHRSIRDFTSAPVREEDFRAAIAAAQSAATSSHLQSWSVVRVSDPANKRELNKLCGRQGQIETAPLMLVWLADQSRNYAIGKAEGTPTEAFDYFESTMLGIVDCCMGAQNAALAFEALGYGTCFIGAVRNNAEALSAILALPERCIPVVGLVVGRPSSHHETDIKPRLSQNVIVHKETYHRAKAAEISDYNLVMNRFQTRQWMSTIDWTTKVAARLSTKAALDGRDRYMDYIKSTGSGVR